jgi:dipeptidyl aminopeptidase/acylaminoacyl peptidase
MSAVNRPASICVLASAFVLSATAQSGRPLALNDVLTAVRVADAQLSPDGKSVAFVRTTTDLAKNKRHSEIWSVATAGGAAPRALISIASDKNDNTPRWSPDGSRIAFISTRDGESQVYLADATGANAKKLTHVAGGVQPPLVWSPDGTMVGFVADVYPECADDACNRAKMDAADKNPVKVHQLTRLLYRHWDEWRDGVRHHAFVSNVNGGASRDVTPGDFDSPPTQQEDGGIQFTSDSTSIAFVSNREGNDKEAWTTNNDVFEVPVGGGAAKKLPPNPAADAQPTFTKDGKSMIVRAQRRPGFESDRFYVDVYDRATGTKRTVFTTPDLSVSDYALARDGKTIYFTATSNGTDNLYSVPLAGGTPKEAVHGGTIGGLSIGDAAIVYSRTSMRAPAEIYASPIPVMAVGDTALGPVQMAMAAAGSAVQLTHENDGWLKDVTTNVPETRTVLGANGALVQYWIVKPPAFDASKKYPVVFMIHGGPQGDWGDGWSYRWNPSLWAAQGWVVVAPNPRGSTGFGQTFVDEISQDWGGKVMVDLNAVFDAVSRLPYTDSSKMGIAGASYGGYAVDWIIGHTNRFKVAVTHDGVFNMESMSLATEELWFSEWEAGGAATTPLARGNFAKWSPHFSAGNIKTPTLVITNEQDFRVPVDQGLQLFTVLRRNGVPSEALVFPDEGHWVLKPLNSQLWHQKVFDWIGRFLK